MTKLRRARATDQLTITRLVYSSRLNPLGLRWAHFTVAETQGKIVGIGQLKPHRDRSLELASLAVVPEYQGRGLGAALIYALLAEADRKPFLFCRHELGAYYARFGFVKLAPAAMPPDMRRLYGAVGLAADIVRQPHPILVMGWRPHGGLPSTSTRRLKRSDR
jgi:N-acetylglutamate synthase-like GNAT family acetyltransferase